MNESVVQAADLTSYIDGHISLETTVAGVRPWRLPWKMQESFPSPNGSLLESARMAAGIRIQFRSGAELVRIRCSLFGPGESVSFDLTQGGIILETIDLLMPSKTIEIDFLLSGNNQDQYEIWLPQFAEILLHSIQAEGGYLEPSNETQARWIAYGSSITQCRQARSPARTWPATAARKLNLNLTSLGFRGECHLDGMVAKVIRDSPANIITLKTGINCYEKASLSRRSYLPTLVNMVQTIREKHHLTPIGIISPIYSSHREKETNLHNHTLEDFRAWNREAYELLKKSGDTNLYFFDGLNLLGKEDKERLPDTIHPDDEGYALIGARAAEIILPLLMNPIQEKYHVP